MGHAVGTGSLLLISTILTVIMGVFLVIAQNSVNDANDINTNDKLNDAKNYIITAYIIAFVAAGITLLISVLYFAQDNLLWNEAIHAGFIFIIFALIIISGIFGFAAISNLNDANTDTNGATGWVWASLIAGGVSLIVLIISGAWRISYLSNNNVKENNIKVNNIEKTSTVVSREPSYQPPKLVKSTDANVRMM